LPNSNSAGQNAGSSPCQADLDLVTLLYKAFRNGDPTDVSSLSGSHFAWLLETRMDLHDALTQLDHIQKQLAHSATFRGYRSVPAALSAGIALLAATAQMIWLPSVSEHPWQFVLLWVGVAVVCGFIQLLEIVLWARKEGRQVTTRLTVRALEMLIPCLVAGACLTLALVCVAPDSLWLLPGLWSLLLCLGIFASLPVLPRAISLLGFHYFFSGIACIVVFRGPWAFSPWSMAITFGGGQFLAALLLYFTLERRHD